MEKASSTLHTGGCYCKAVLYEVKGPLRGVVNCHCSQCTKLNGNFGSHAKAAKTALKITKDEGLGWFHISEYARRGFCRNCGSALFWDNMKQKGMGIIAGTLDPPTGLKTIGHIFIGSKSDFYGIADDIPQFNASSQGKIEGDHL